MNLKTLLVLLICSVLSASGALVRSENDHNTDIRKLDFNVNSRLPIFQLSPDIFLHIFEYLHNSYLDVLLVCKEFEDIFNDKKTKYFQSLNIYPVLKNIENKAEIYQLLKLKPSILNQFFDDFVFSTYCFKVMNLSVRNNSKITSNSFNQIIFGYWIDSVLPNKFRNENEFIYWLSHSNMHFFDFYDLFLFNFSQLDRNSSLFMKSRSFLKAMLIRYDFNVYQLIPLFKFKLTAKDIEFLLEDYQKKTSAILDNILKIALDAKMEYSAEDKLFIRNRNNELLLSIPQIPNDSQDSITGNEIEDSLIRIRKTANYKLHVEMINSIRYSVDSDNDDIIEKYFNVKGGDFDDDLTEAFAVAAILAGNINLFYRMYHLRNQMKYSVKFYSLIAYSKKLIKIVPSEALLNLFEVPKNCDNFDWTFRFEVLARKSIDERSLSDLESLFSNDELGKLFATALYYPIDYYLENIGQKPKLITRLINLLYSPCMKFRNNLNDPFLIVYQIVKFISSLDETKARQSRISAKNLLCEYEFLKTCFDPKNKNMFDQVINSMDLGYNHFPLTPEIVKDSKFIENLKSSHVSKLIGMFYFNLLDLTDTDSHMLAHEIVEIAEVLGLQIGDFHVNSLEVVTNIYPYVSDAEVKIFQGTKIALTDFKTVQRYYNNSRNPMLLSSFGIFQLWWDRNPQSFEQFAPKDLVKDFKMRLLSF